MVASSRPSTPIDAETRETGTVVVNRKIRKNHKLCHESFLVRCHGLSLFYRYIRREKKKRKKRKGGWKRKEPRELIRRIKGRSLSFSITRNVNFINIALVARGGGSLSRRLVKRGWPRGLFVSKFSFSKEQNSPFPTIVRFNRINPVWISSVLLLFFLSLRHWPPPTITFALLVWISCPAGICARAFHHQKFAPVLSPIRSVFALWWPMYLYFVYIERERNRCVLRDLSRVIRKKKRIDKLF